MTRQGPCTQIFGGVPREARLPAVPLPSGHPSGWTREGYAVGLGPPQGTTSAALWPCLSSAAGPHSSPGIRPSFEGLPEGPPCRSCSLGPSLVDPGAHAPAGGVGRTPVCSEHPRRAERGDSRSGFWWLERQQRQCPTTDQQSDPGSRPGAVPARRGRQGHWGPGSHKTQVPGFGKNHCVVK